MVTYGHCFAGPLQTVACSQPCIYFLATSNLSTSHLRLSVCDHLLDIMKEWTKCVRLCVNGKVSVVTTLAKVKEEQTSLQRYIFSSMECHRLPCSQLTCFRGTYQGAGKLITHPDYNIKGKNNQFGLLVELGCGELTHSNVHMETLTLLKINVHNSATTFVPSYTFLLSSHYHQRVM